ncbi:flagella basal body rod family protein, partial [Vibrio parahaemolyticus V-223/04]
WISMKS